MSGTSRFVSRRAGGAASRGLEARQRARAAISPSLCREAPPSWPMAVRRRGQRHPKTTGMSTSRDTMRAASSQHCRWPSCPPRRRRTALGAGDLRRGCSTALRKARSATYSAATPTPSRPRRDRTAWSYPHLHRRCVAAAGDWETVDYESPSASSRDHYPELFSRAGRSRRVRLSAAPAASALRRARRVWPRVGGNSYQVTSTPGVHRDGHALALREGHGDHM